MTLSKKIMGSIARFDAIQYSSIDSQSLDWLSFIKDLTSQKSQESLSKCFIRHIVSIWEDGEVKFYRAENGRAIEATRRLVLGDVSVIDLLNENDKSAIRLDDIPGFMRSAGNTNSSKSDQYKDDINSIVFPISGHKGTYALLVLTCPYFDPAKNTELFRYILIFENLLQVFESAERDALTGLYNRKAFGNILNSISGKQNRSDKYLVLMDLDHFKRINDTYGHLYGDEVLLRFSELLEESFRRCDWVFRYGGEEFAVVVDGIDEQNILLVLERFRKKVERHGFPLVGHVTVSIGATQWDANTAIPLLVGRADQALYYSKEHGRNQFNIYSDIKNSVSPESTGGDITLFKKS